MQRLIRLGLVGLVGLALVSCAAAQEFEFPEAAVTAPAILDRMMPSLARQALAVYQEKDREKYLANVFSLQILAGRYLEAAQSLAELRELRRPGNALRAGWVNRQYEIYARTKARQEAERSAFDKVYQETFREELAKMDDRTAALLMREVTFVDESWIRPAVTFDLNRQKGKTTITLADALDLASDYASLQAYHEPAALLPDLVAEDDNRRYILDKDIRVNVADGATVCAFVMRPRGMAQRLPALLNFTIYVDRNSYMNDIRQSASNGYVGVDGFTRGKACSPNKPVPYVHDGADAAALIDWISKQPWSDDRVGMYSGSYDGFTQFAAAKCMPRALKTLMAGVPAAPGIDVPMEGNVFWNFLYPWTFYTTDVKANDDKVYSDRARWQKLSHDWYVTGRSYRDLDKVDGTPNPIFDEWLNHPSYDAYWQDMIPYRNDFAKIQIPVLITAGYYYGGPGAAVYYYSQLEKFVPNAEHYLLIGPYDHSGGQFGVIGLLGQVFDTVGELKVDPVAQIDISDDLRYQWFDYIFKAGPKPALLADRVNYEVTGADIWKHAPKLAGMHLSAKRLYFGPQRKVGTYLLTENKPSPLQHVKLEVNLSDRTDVDRKAPGGDVRGKEIDTHNGIEFVSDPLTAAIEMSGLFSGQLDFVTNRKDFDFEIDLYELTSQGDYVQLAPYWARASYVGDLSHRRLLSPGHRRRIPFRSVRLMSRRLQAGSGVVAVLRLIKEAGRQINYGTGKDVSDETIEDASVPLEINWYSDSYIDLPIGK